ncbi:MAG: NAD(P)H-hydrate dehydratase, partial [Chloroflexota bacterium]
DIGTPSGLEELAAVTVELLSAADVKHILPLRQSSAHKGTYGRAMIVAGSVNYTGAAALSALAAYRVGAGLVTLAVPQAIYPVLAAQILEPTWLLLPHDMGVINTAAFEVFQAEAGEYDALLIGPGLGRDRETAGFLHGLLEGSSHLKKGSIGFLDQPERDSGVAGSAHFAGPLIVDADGLNLLSEMERWWELLPPNTILTPHPGEMARLTGLEIEDVNARRFDLAAEKAREWNCVVVLKGAFTVVAAPDGRQAVIPFATDALATAGTGDVLAGTIVGLLAQGVEPFEAAAAGAYTHGLAGQLAGGRMTSRSTIAGDVLELLPNALRRIDREF